MTWRGLRARRVRLGLTGLAVALGVALASAVFVTTDTLQRAYDSLFDEVVAGVDLAVRSEAGFGGSATPRQRMPEVVVDQVLGVRGVEAAEGVVTIPGAQFVDSSGAPIRNGAVPTIGLSWPDLDGRGPLRAIEGRPPVAAGEVGMDADTARRNGFSVGDSVDVVFNAPAERFVVTGVFEVGGTQDLGGVTIAAFSLDQAQELFGAEGALDVVYVTVADGEDVDIVADRVAAAVPGFDVVPATEFADQTGAPVRIALELVSYALLGFAGIGLVVGAFIIFNTFAILVSQRVRELGMLRTLGASPRQVWVSVLLEAIVLGAVGSAVGLGIGVLAGAALVALLPTLGFEVPDSSLVVLGRTVVVAISIGIAVTVAAAAIPAQRAAATSPIDALDDRRSRRRRPLLWRAVIGFAIVMAALVATGLALWWRDTDVIAAVAAAVAGAALGLIGLVVLGPVIVVPMVAALGSLTWVSGIVGRLARRNAQRNPRRTAATALALVTGIALVSLSAVLVQSFRESLRNGLAQGLEADLVLSGDQFSGFSPELVERLRPLPEVQAATGIRFADARVEGVVQRVASMSAEGIEDLVDLDVVDGSLDDYGPETILLHEDTVEGVRAGDVVVFELPGIGPQPRRVGAVYANRQFAGLVPVSVLVTEESFDAAFGSAAQDTFAFVRSAGPPDSARAAIEPILGDFPNANLLTPEEFRAEQEEPVDLVSGVLVALLVLSVAIALLGVVNTLFLTVFERTHEIGLLRSVGMSRRQVRASVRAESVLIAAAGCAIGILLGLGWAWSLTTVLESQGFSVFALPVGQIVVLALGGLVAGVVAAWLPARRAARLDVLEAIAQE